MVEGTEKVWVAGRNVKVKAVIKVFNGFGEVTEGEETVGVHMWKRHFEKVIYE